MPYSSDLKLNHQEKNLVILLSLLLLSNAMAQKLSEIISVSSFVSNVGISQILWVWMLDGVLMIIVTGLQSLLIDRYSRLKILQVVSLGLAFSFGALQVLFWFDAPIWLSQSLLYLLSQQQWMTFPLTFWIFANDLLSVSQAKRLMPRIASWGFVGSSVGISLAALSSIIFGRLALPSEWLVTCNVVVNVAIYVGIFVCLRFQLSQYRTRKLPNLVVPLKVSVSEGWKFIHNVDLFRYLAISVVCVVICETVVEFRFLSLSTYIYSDQYTYQSFYSLYLFARAFLESLSSKFLAHAVITHLRLKAVFLVQPLFSLVASSLMIFTPHFLGSLAGIFLQKNPQYSLDEPARKALQGLVPDERRGRVSIFVDSYLVGAGGILGAAAIAGIFLVGSQLNQDMLSNRFYVCIASVAAVAALLSTWKMREVYDHSLLNWRLKRRKRGIGILESFYS